MTFQTQKPVDDLRMNISARSCGDLIHQQESRMLTWDLPYQRGAVWTTEQRILLIYSLLSGTPVPAIIINSRPDHMWYGPTGKIDQPCYAVIDGKQRLMTVAMWMHDELLLPASWFDPQDVLHTQETPDGPYVYYSNLERRQGRFFENKPLPVAEARLGSVRAEAEIYLRVNGSGTPQTEEDMGRAAKIAGILSQEEVKPVHDIDHVRISYRDSFGAELIGSKVSGPFTPGQKITVPAIPLLEMT